ncbi:MAG: HD domain-containing protein [Candidatus Aenigmarchaeota archaeon]|nr:HD domain-containing protein [Candidatus Aenigmarchaeota archaeon]
MDEKALLSEAKAFMEGADPAHDFSHVLRVLALAKAICKKENADMEILIPAAILHDIGRQDKSSLEKRRLSADESALMASEILKKHGFPERKIGKILYSITVHGFSKGVTPETLEAKILQDADRLDAIGAIGMARCFAVGGQLKRQLHHAEDPLAKNREPDDGLYSVDHFYRKLMLLKSGMHTGTGRRLAERRHKFLETFLEQLETDIKGR